VHHTKVKSVNYKFTSLAYVACIMLGALLALSRKCAKFDILMHVINSACCSFREVDYWVKSIISTTKLEEEGGGTGRFLCVVHLCIMIS